MNNKTCSLLVLQNIIIIMPKRCAIHNCRSNYIGELYTPVVRFPTDNDERKDRLKQCHVLGSLKERREMLVCASF